MGWITRIGLVAAAGALATAPVVAQAAPEDGTSSSAAEVSGGEEEGFTVGHAAADAGSGSAQADPVAGGGHTAGGTAEEGSGGVDTAEHNAEGRIGRAQVLAWEASSSGSSAESRAVLMRVTVNNEAEGDVAEVALVDSQASDGGGAAQSSGDAGRVSLGGDQLLVSVLHAEADGSGSGSSYLVGVNEHQVMSSEQADGKCAGEVPGVFRVECFKVVAASGQAAAAVAEGSAGDDQLGASVFAAQASPSAVTTADGGFSSMGSTVDFSSDFEGTDSGGFAGALARTGIDLVPLALAGLMLLVVGGMAMVGTREDTPA